MADVPTAGARSRFRRSRGLFAEGLSTLHDRDPAATIARTTVNVTTFAGLGIGAATLDLWVSRLVRDVHRHDVSGLELLFQAVAALLFLAVPALLVGLVVLEVIGRRFDYARVIAIGGSVAFGVIASPLYDDLIGGKGAEKALGVGLALVYGLIVVVPRTAATRDLRFGTRAILAVASAVVAVATYAVWSYRDAGIDHPVPFTVETSEVRVIEIDRADVDAPGPLFLREGADGLRASVPLRAVERFLPHELPRQLFQPEDCRPDVTVRLELVDGEEVTYGPCRLPRDVEKLRRRLAEIWQRRAPTADGRGVSP